MRDLMLSKPNKPKILVGHVQGDPADLLEGVIYAPGRDPDVPPRVSKQVAVIDDRKLIAWTRKAYGADLDHRFAVALEQVRSGEWVCVEFRDALEQRAERATEELCRIMRNKRVTPKGRARAAEVLASLGRSEGGEVLVAALESPSADLCAAAVEMLGDWKSKVDLTQPAIAARIVNLLSSPDPEVVKKAAHLCAWRKVAGAEDGLRSAVLKGAGPLDELSETLARLA